MALADKQKITKNKKNLTNSDNGAIIAKLAHNFFLNIVN